MFRILFVCIMLWVALLSPRAALAQTAKDINLFTRAPIDNIKPSPFRLPNLTKDFGDKTTVQDVVNFIVRWVAYLGGIAAFVVVLYGGFRYITAGGNPAATDQAKRMIIGAIVGMLIIALSYLVVQFVVQQATNLR